MSFAAPAGKRRGLRDWTELIFKDHGFLRVWWHNLHEIAPGMWRSNQPGPGRVLAAAQMGVRTIINLRGPRDDGGWQLEAEACAAARDEDDLPLKEARRKRAGLRRHVAH